MLDNLAADAAARGVHLSEQQVLHFGDYFELLADAGQRTNLVSEADLAVVETRHFGESLALGAMLREREVLRPDSAVLDVGAGAGFPGLPIKIAWPGITLTLVEATGKKCAFLRDVTARLGLEGVIVLHGRAETLAHDPALRGRFDLVLARAVAPLPALVELTLPFARIGGRVVTPKGSRAREELAAATHALDVLGGRAHVLPFSVPGPAQTVVVVAKQRDTPAAYPRRPGVPARSPL